MWDPAPLESSPRDDAESFLNQCYTCTSNDVTDPTMVWSSQVDMTEMRRYLAAQNETSATLLTPTAALIRLVGKALQEHPGLNARLVGRRVYRFTECNVLVPVLQESGPKLLLMRKADQLSYVDVASRLQQEVTQTLHQPQRSWGERIHRLLPGFMQPFAVRGLLRVANSFRLRLGPITQQIDGAAVMVNYFGFSCAPPMLAYKPSRFGSRATLLNVTLGPTSSRPVVENDAVVIRPISGLFVRADHRICDVRPLSNFIKTLVTMLEHPGDHDLASPADSSA